MPTTAFSLSLSSTFSPASSISTPSRSTSSSTNFLLLHVKLSALLFCFTASVGAFYDLTEVDCRTARSGYVKDHPLLWYDCKTDKCKVRIITLRIIRYVSLGILPHLFMCMLCLCMFIFVYVCILYACVFIFMIL